MVVGARLSSGIPESVAKSFGPLELLRLLGAANKTAVVVEIVILLKQQGIWMGE
jgi:hypothetical protein